LTDVTFIYVVYILTFVSAVVMLFLSVVLMLPSSALAVSKRAALPLLFTVSASSFEPTANTVSIPSVIYAIIVLIVFYLVVAILRRVKHIDSESDSRIKIIYDGADNSSLKYFTESNDFRLISTNSRTKGLNAYYCRIFENCSFRPTLKSHGAERYVTIRAVPNFFYLTGKNTVLNPVLNLVYEFMNFYLLRLEPKLFLTSPVYVKATSGLRSFARANTAYIESIFYSFGQRRSVIFIPKLTAQYHIVLELYTPW
jgi:hypothetical protein